MKHLVINSESSGSYRLEKRGGRKFLVTQMLPIQADSIMNGLLYPARSVMESYLQLDKLPAPAGHPVFNGKSVSAFDPEGASSFNVGAFIRSPELSGSNVFADLVIDQEVANRSDEGKEIIKRIKSGRRMGVSTGLKGSVMETNGKKNGKEYYGIVDNIEFDHVAILLSEAPAGDNTYTLNSSEFFKPQQKGKSVMREVTINTEDLSLDDHKALEAAASNPKGLLNAMQQNVSVERAIEIVNHAGQHVMDCSKVVVDDYLANKDQFQAFKAIQAEKRKEKVEFVIANSKMEQEQIESLEDGALDSLVNSLTPANKHIMNGKVQEKAVFTPLEDA